MNEVAFSLGADNNLVCVLTEAVGEAKPLAVLLLNAGVVHRIGPHRTNVKLARSLANAGMTAVRFDISGVGDSRPPKDAAPFREQAVRDIRLVMDHLEQTRGIKQFALYGICAGAINGYAACMQDSRVTGLFMFDGYAYPTNKSRAIQLWARMRSRTLPGALMAAWQRIGKFATSLAGPRAIAGISGGVAPAASSQPSRQQFAANMQSMVDRGVRMVMLFSGSVFQEYSYGGQFQDGFRGHSFVGKVACHHLPTIDHLVTPLAGQQRLIEMVGDWASRIGSRS